MTRVDVVTNERIFDDRHHLHEFGEFWAESAAILVFLPQFGSSFGLVQAKALAPHQQEIRRLGARLVVIGLGTSVAGYTFRQRAGLRDPVMVTKDATLYRSMGLGRAPRTVGVRRNASSFAASVRRGDWPYQRTGDPGRLGGVFIVARGGSSVVWEHRQRFAADTVDGQSVRDELAAATDRTGALPL